MSSNTGSIIAAIAAGAAVGVGVGILLAPDKGSKTRKKIKDGFDSSKDDVLEKLNDLMNGVKSKVSETVPKLEDALESAVPSSKADKDALISLLQKKLETLKSAK